jgi:hypothetical protein
VAGSPSQVAQVTVTVPHSESGPNCDSATLRMLACQLNSFVLVACAMCASSHHGDILHPCSPCDVMATPGRCQRVLLGLVLARQLLWERLALTLVWRIRTVVRLEWRVALAECYLRQAHRRTDLEIAWSRCTSGCRTHDSSGGRWVRRI